MNNWTKWAIFGRTNRSSKFSIFLCMNCPKHFFSFHYLSIMDTRCDRQMNGGLMQYSAWLWQHQRDINSCWHTLGSCTLTLLACRWGFHPETYTKLNWLKFLYVTVLRANKKPSCRWGTARVRRQLKSSKMLHKCSTDCTWKGLQTGNDLQGHSRSLTLVPFDRPHTISY